MAYIEIDQGTGLLNAVHKESAPGRIRLKKADAKKIAVSRYGHAQFMYIGGELKESPDALMELEGRRKRGSAVLSRMQFMLALDRENLLTRVEAAMSNPTTEKRILIMWQNAGSFERRHPDLIDTAQSLGITPAQVDAVFGI